MAVDRDYKFVVYPSDLDPYGPVGKENADVIRLTYDFSCYLEAGETLQAIEFPKIAQAQSVAGIGNWRSDYPVDCPTTLAVTEDLYPLKVVSESITNLGKYVEIRLNSGTPDFTYVLSFLILASDTRRRKQIDTLIDIEHAINPMTIGPGDLDPDIVPPIIVNESTALPIGFNGLVIFQNTSNNSGVIITLPPNPEPGQEVEFIDALGKDEAYPVTFRGDGDVPIDGDGRVNFVSSINFDCLRFVWMGSNWHLIMNRFDGLA